jgi:hypothetical protein
MQPPSSSFTIKSTGGVLRVLQTHCAVAEAFDPATTPAPYPQFHQFQAIWDTGATISAVTQKVIDTCGLKPISMTDVHGVGGVHRSEVYLVNIVLPNNIGVKQVRVTRGILANVDVLFGMDIITIGDFAITNRGGITVFTFCFPSHRCLDFVDEYNKAAQVAQAATPLPGFRGYKPPQQAKPRRHK